MWVCVYIHLISHKPVRGGLHAGHPKTGTRGTDEHSGSQKQNSRPFITVNRQAHKLLPLNSSQTALDKVILLSRLHHFDYMQSETII